MKVKFIEAPKGRHFKVGEVHEFTGPVAEGYARKYINRGWAVEHHEPPPVAVTKPSAAHVHINDLMGGPKPQHLAKPR